MNHNASIGIITHFILDSVEQFFANWLRKNNKMIIFSKTAHVIVYPFDQIVLYQTTKKRIKSIALFTSCRLVKC